MRKANWGSIEEAKSFELLPVGGYVCQILRVEDKEDKEYLEIEFDIIEGKYRDYFTEQAAHLNFWTGKFIKSYKVSAEKFFKTFLTAIEKSNSGFIADKFDCNPVTLEGKRIGLVIGHEKYWKQDGKEATKINVDQVRSLESIKKGEFKLPELKINDYNKPSGAISVMDLDKDFTFMADDDDIPF